MPQFTIRPELNVRDIPAAVGPFLEIVGFQRLQKRIESFAKQAHSNNFAQGFFSDRHALEFELWDLVSQYRKFGRLPAVSTPDGYISDQLRAYAFIWLLAKVSAQLNPIARKRLQGRFEHAFTDEQDVLSIEHELKTISHLCRYGCQVTCHDLEGDGGYDFLAVREGLEFEVECKMISADKGRQLHQHDVTKLGEHYGKALDISALKATRSGVIVRLHVAGRLPRNPETLRVIATDAAQAAVGNVPPPRTEWRVERQTFPIAGSPFQRWGVELDWNAIHEFLYRMTGEIQNKPLIYAAEGEAAAILCVESDKPDQVMDHLYLELKRAAKQLSGTRPGALYTAFKNFSSGEMLLVSDMPPGPLDDVVNRLFANPERAHVYGVTYFSESEYRPLPKGEMTHDGKVLRFINLHNTFSEDRRLRLDSDQILSAELGFPPP